METSLHRQLKQAYAAQPSATEVVLSDFRIDAINAEGELVEIQHASLGALRVKAGRILQADEQLRLRVVKPIVGRKWIVTRASRKGPVLRRRLSPKRGRLCDVFLDLVYFAKVFPHPRLTLEVILVDVEEHRIPKLKHRFRRKNYTTLEQTLLAMHERREIRTAHELWSLLPATAMPQVFDTAELARQIQRPRWFAQKVAYCLRHAAAITPVGKSGNSQLYSCVAPRSRRKPRRAS